MKAFKNFLKALATEGGHIFVLAFFATLMLISISVLSYLPPAYEKASDALLPILGLVFGALLMFLKSKFDDGNDDLDSVK